MSDQLCTGHNKQEGWLIGDCICEELTKARADERYKVAEAIFNEEQQNWLTLSVEPTNAYRNGYSLGLQRARDIAREGA